MSRQLPPGVAAVALIYHRAYEQALGVHHGCKHHDFAVVPLFLGTTIPAQPALLHPSLEIGVGDVEQEYLLLDAEHAAHPGVEPVLQPPVILPQVPGALVQRILGDLLPGYAEHLRQGRILLKVAYGLQLGIRVDGTRDNLHDGEARLFLCPASGMEISANVQKLHGGVTEVLAADDAGLVLGEGVDLYGDGFLSFLLLTGLALGYEAGVVLLGVTAVAVLHVLAHGLLVKSTVRAHHALPFLYHGGEHPCQLVPLRLAETGQLSKAKDTPVPGLAILVGVRLRETVVIIADCRAVSPVTVFLCLGYIHSGGKGKYLFQRDKTDGCSILGVTKEKWTILKIFIQNRNQIENFGGLKQLPVGNI